MTHLFHGNDFELDQYAKYQDAVPAQNGEHLFAILKDHGYTANLVGLNVYPEVAPKELIFWPGSISDPFRSADPSEVVHAVDRMTDQQPFAIYLWNLISHVEHSGAFAREAGSLTERLQCAYQMADDMIGAMVRRLDEKGVLANTLIVLYGDHGDDFWGHGFKGGMVHAIEPYANMVWTPLAFWSRAREPGLDNRMASTIDVRATCFELLGIEHRDDFPHSGRSLLSKKQSLVYSQNFMANQPDDVAIDIARAIAVYNDTYCMLASSRGLEMYAYRLDPTNQCNLLNFFATAPDGGIRLREFNGARPHFLSAIRDGEAISNSINRNYKELRVCLAERIRIKAEYLADKLPVSQISTWPVEIVERLDTTRRNAFFNLRTTSSGLGYRFV